MKKETLRFMQGDVQGKSIDSLPPNARKIENTPIAYGEHSGHQHCLTGDVELFELDGVYFACVGRDGAVLQHVHESNFTELSWKTTKELPIADHRPHRLPEGVYQFGIQNSYNPYSKLMEKVID